MKSPREVFKADVRTRITSLTHRRWLRPSQQAIGDCVAWVLEGADIYAGHAVKAETRRLLLRQHEGKERLRAQLATLTDELDALRERAASLEAERDALKAALSAASEHADPAEPPAPAATPAPRKRPARSTGNGKGRSRTAAPEGAEDAGT